MAFFKMCLADNLQDASDCGGLARRETEQRAEQEGKDGGEGTYNPKSAWMFVDSRRKVLPDIDGN
jgi:hypothetical protein